MARASSQPTGSTLDNAIVYIVDDDPLVRDALTRMFKSLELRVAAFASAGEFLDSQRADSPACLILDVQMPEQTGIELQQQLVAGDIDLPIIFLTAHGDVPMTVQAMRSGASDFFTKPVDQDQLVRAVQEALQRHAAQREENAALREFRGRVASLSQRERQVLTLAVAGLLNKQIASRLGITERTVKEHRGRVMKKTGIASIAELARLCERAGVAEPEV